MRNENDFFVQELSLFWGKIKRNILAYILPKALDTLCHLVTSSRFYMHAHTRQHIFLFTINVL